jgi:hypothetical protein
VDDDDIEDAIEDSTQELVSSEQVVARYEALITLWAHRDGITQQWPSLIVSASAAVLAIVFGQKTPEQLVAIASWRNWGDPSRLDVSIGAGIPILVTGLLALPFVYGIHRAGTSMESLAKRIMEIERDRFAIPLEATFIPVNRPPGWSVRGLVKGALAVMAYSMVAIGSLMTFGISGGSILSAVVAAISVMYVQSARFSTRYAESLGIVVGTDSDSGSTPDDER